MMHDFAKNGKKKRRIVLNDTAFYGPRGIRTLDLSDANRTLSQLSYRPMMMTLIVYRVLGRLSSNFGERKRGLTSGRAARKPRHWLRLR